MTHDPSCPNLTSQDWVMLGAISQVLGNFKSCTDKFSSCDPSLDNVQPSLGIIHQRISLSKRGLTVAWDDALDACAAKLEKYIVKALQNDWVCIAVGQFSVLFTSQFGSLHVELSNLIIGLMVCSRS